VISPPHPDCGVDLIATKGGAGGARGWTKQDGMRRLWLRAFDAIRRTFPALREFELAGARFFWVLDSWGSGCLQEIGNEPILSHGVKPKAAHGGASFEKMPIVFHDQSLQRIPAQKVALGVALSKCF